MSYEHGTTHYNLPQTVGSDTRDWFDTNEAFADIDAAIYSASQTAEQSVQDLTEVKADVQGLKDADIAMTGRVDGIEVRVGASEQAIGRLEQKVADVDTDLMDSICAINEASATAAYRHLTGEFFWYNDTLYIATADIGVGNQIVPDTNCRTTNITTELLTLRKDKADNTDFTSVSGYTCANSPNLASGLLGGWYDKHYIVNYGELLFNSSITEYTDISGGTDRLFTLGKVSGNLFNLDVSTLSDGYTKKFLLGVINANCVIVSNNERFGAPMSVYAGFDGTYTYFFSHAAPAWFTTYKLLEMNYTITQLRKH